MGWLFSTMIPSILAQVAIVQTSDKSGGRCPTLYSSTSMIHVLHLQRQFLNLKKGSMIMMEYLTHVRLLLGSLIAVGENLSQSEIIIAVIGGLGIESESFVQSITTKFDHSMTNIDLQSLLMDKEMSHPLEIPSLPSINLVSSDAFNSDVKLVSCQICNKKGHGTLNCYGQFNAN